MRMETRSFCFDFSVQENFFDVLCAGNASSFSNAVFVAAVAVRIRSRTC